MFKWLNGPGVNFKNPLPGSTNYLNAYDYSGELIRVKDRGERKPSDDDTPATEDAEMPSTSEMNLQGNKPIPKESLDDLMPFPQNRQFRSQPVLSEEFKDEIYERVVRQGQHIRRVCNDLHVDMARVGAVVRLKAIEEQWKQQVSLFRNFSEREQAIPIFRLEPTMSRRRAMMRQNSKPDFD